MQSKPVIPNAELSRKAETSRRNPGTPAIVLKQLAGIARSRARQVPIDKTYGISYMIINAMTIGVTLPPDKGIIRLCWKKSPSGYAKKY